MHPQHVSSHPDKFFTDNLQSDFQYVSAFSNHWLGWPADLSKLPFVAGQTDEQNLEFCKTLKCPSIARARTSLPTMLNGVRSGRTGVLFTKSWPWLWRMPVLSFSRSFNFGVGKRKFLKTCLVVSVWRKPCGCTFECIENSETNTCTRRLGATVLKDYSASRIFGWSDPQNVVNEWRSLLRGANNSQRIPRSFETDPTQCRGCLVRNLSSPLESSFYHVTPSRMRQRSVIKPSRHSSSRPPRNGSGPNR